MWFRKMVNSYPETIEVSAMEAMELLLVANAVVWLGVCGYVAFLAGQTGQIRQRLQQIELKEESDARDEW
jgi:CcmD family protein